jgi:hypothetical protein
LQSQHTTLKTIASCCAIAAGKPLHMKVGSVKSVCNQPKSQSRLPHQRNETKDSNKKDSNERVVKKTQKMELSTKSDFFLKVAQFRKTNNINKEINKEINK